MQNISIAVVGKNEKFRILNDVETAVYVAAVEKRGGSGPGGSGDDGDATIPAADVADEPRDRPRDTGDPIPLVAMET